MIDFNSMKEIFWQLLGYVPVTLALTASSVLLACLLGFLTVAVRLGKVPVLAQLSELYVLLCRALPTVIVLYIVFFGIPVFFMEISGNENQTALMNKIPPFVYAVIGLGLHAGAYMSEIFRSAFRSVSTDQMEAALSVGMSPGQAVARIIIPQAAVLAMPMLANQVLNVLKGSSIAFMITVVELFGASTIAASMTNLYLEIYLLIAGMYWFVSIVIEKLFLSAETRLAYFKKA